jgi:hypothetical protein
MKPLAAPNSHVRNITPPREPKQERSATRGAFHAHIAAGFGGVRVEGTW